AEYPSTRERASATPEASPRRDNNNSLSWAISGAVTGPAAGRQPIRARPRSVMASIRSARKAGRSAPKTLIMAISSAPLISKSYPDIFIMSILSYLTSACYESHRKGREPIIVHDWPDQAGIGERHSQRGTSPRRAAGSRGTGPAIRLFAHADPLCGPAIGGLRPGRGAAQGWHLRHPVKHRANYRAVRGDGENRGSLRAARGPAHPRGGAYRNAPGPCRLFRSGGGRRCGSLLPS